MTTPIEELRAVVTLPLGTDLEFSAHNKACLDEMEARDRIMTFLTSEGAVEEVARTIKVRSETAGQFGHLRSAPLPDHVAAEYATAILDLIASRGLGG